VKTAQGSEDPATIKGATEALSQAMMKIGEAMMKAQPTENSEQKADDQKPSEGGADPTDAEFKEKPE